MNKKYFKLFYIFSIILIMIFSVVWNLNAINKTEQNTKIVDDKSEITDKIPVLMYHQFRDKTNAGSVVAKEEFKKQIKYLKDNGYNTITLKQLIDFKQGKENLPKKSILITSDDGYLSNYEFMYPILKENNMKATIFVIGESIDNAKENTELNKYNPKFSWATSKGNV